MIIIPLITFGQSVSASSSEPSEKEIDEMVEKIEYILTEGFSYDENGNLEQINFDKIEEKYGYDADLEKFKVEFVQAKYSRALADPGCVIKKVASKYGVDLGKTIGYGTVGALLAGSSLRTLAKEILKKYVGPAGLVSIIATLANITVQCGASSGGGSYDCSVYPPGSQQGCK